MSGGVGDGGGDIWVSGKGFSTSHCDEGSGGSASLSEVDEASPSSSSPLGGWDGAGAGAGDGQNCTRRSFCRGRGVVKSS